MDIPKFTFEFSVSSCIHEYQYILYGSLAQYLAASALIGGDVATHSRMVQEAFKTQLEYLKFAAQTKTPSMAEIKTLVKDTSDSILKVQEFRDKNRQSEYYNHLCVIGESIPALGWVIVTPSPVVYIRERIEASQFYNINIGKDWKRVGVNNVEWINSWLHTLSELQSFVFHHHASGLTWGKYGVPNGPPPSPSGSCASGISFASNISSMNQDVYLADLFRNMYVTRPYASPQYYSSTYARFPQGVNTPACGREGNKILVKYQRCNRNFVIQGTDISNVVHFYKCIDSAMVVNGRVNSITLEYCTKVSLRFDSVVTKIEFINCQNVQMQVLGKVPTIFIDKTDGCHVYLNNESLDGEIVSTKSSDLKILIPTINGDYAEHTVPQQYKTVVVDKKLSTTTMEN